MKLKRANRMAKKTPEPEAREPNRTPHRVVNVRMDLQLYAAFDAWRNSMLVPPSITDAIEHCVGEYLKSAGFDPANYLPGEVEEES
jgi:hypothetical protein